MGIGSKLSELMATNNTNVNELSRNVGVSPQTIYSIIKRDSKKADIEVLLKIAKLFGVTAEYFVDDPKSDDSEKMQNERPTFSKSEINFIKKYRLLDTSGQKHVDTVLDWEVDHVKAQNNRLKLYSEAVLNAAHERPDATEGEKAISDAVMEDDNEWK